MNRAVLFLILTSLILVVSNCDKGSCELKDDTPRKRVIINNSGVEVSLNGLEGVYKITDSDTILTDTVYSFAYKIANGDSIVAVESCERLQCSSRKGFRFSDSYGINCKSTVRGLGFGGQRATEGELIFANRRVQTFKYRDSLSIFFTNIYTRTWRWTVPDTAVYTHIITPEAYEKARPLNP